MKDFLFAARGVIEDMAATLLFVGLYALTGSVVPAIAAGMALALGQIVWQLARRQHVNALQWVSLALVAGAGSASLWTHDLRFVMVKPSLIYVLVGCAMLERNWMTRYMPPVALSIVPDLVTAFGYVWAGLMFLSALVNLALVTTFGVVAWGLWLTAWGTASKAVLFLFQYAVMRLIGRRRWRAAHT